MDYFKNYKEVTTCRNENLIAARARAWIRVPERLVQKIQEATEPFGQQAAVTLRVNFFDLINVCSNLFPLLRPHARVVNISSAAGFLQHVPGDQLKKKLGDPNLTLNDLTSLMKEFVSAAKAGTHVEAGWPNTFYCPYSVSKVGVSALTRIQQREFLEDAREDIVVNHIHPGYVATDMTNHLGPLTVEQGSDAVTFAALLPAGTTSPKGDFIWHDRQIIDWVNGPTPALY
nr:carbonyl reductase [NADPH] 3-like [Halyomorpha halys]